MIMDDSCIRGARGGPLPAVFPAGIDMLRNPIAQSPITGPRFFAICSSAPRPIETHHHPYTPTYIAKTGDVLRHTTHSFYERLTKWHPDQAIEAMDKSGIAVSVLSISTPSVWLGSAQASRTFARECNE